MFLLSIVFWIKSVKMARFRNFHTLPIAKTISNLKLILTLIEVRNVRAKPTTQIKLIQSPGIQGTLKDYLVNLWQQHGVLWGSFTQICWQQFVLKEYQTGWKFAKLLKQICKIFRNFKMLLQSNYPFRIGNLWIL